MTQNITLFILFVGIFVFWGKGLQAQFSSDPDVAVQTGDAPVVVELFTSQSCSSCPAADKVLSTLAEDKNIIALGCHVTYWNHLSWEDTLSHQECTDRQRNYAALMDKRRVYTPQMIVNGRAEFVGSHRSKAVSAIERAKALQPIDLSLQDKTLNLSLPDVAEGSYRLTLFGTKNAHSEDVKRGENRGRLLKYSNAVTFLRPLGTWQGGAQTQEISIDPDVTYDNLVVLAQSAQNGEILAAGQIRF